MEGRKRVLPTAPSPPPPPPVLEAGGALFRSSSTPRMVHYYFPSAPGLLCVLLPSFNHQCLPWGGDGGFSRVFKLT